MRPALGDHVDHDIGSRRPSYLLLQAIRGSAVCVASYAGICRSAIQGAFDVLFVRTRALSRSGDAVEGAVWADASVVSLNPALEPRHAAVGTTHIGQRYAEQSIAALCARQRSAWLGWRWCCCWPASANGTGNQDASLMALILFIILRTTKELVKAEGRSNR